MTFAAGDGEPKEVKLYVFNDEIEENLEQLYIELEFVDISAAAAAGQVLLVPDHKASVIVYDDDSSSK